MLVAPAREGRVIGPRSVAARMADGRAVVHQRAAPLESLSVGPERLPLTSTWARVARVAARQGAPLQFWMMMSST